MTRGSRDDRKGLAAVWLASLLLWLPLAGVADGGDELFPRPPAIREAVAFWTRIYTEVDTGGGLLHDDRHLGIVYETIRFTREQSRRSRERQVKARKRHYRAILRRLAQGRYQFLTAEEKRVLALWPKGTGRKEFLAAARRLRFQLGQADKFRAGLERAGQWESHIRRALREEGVPDELAALPHVESSYNPRAWSRVGAAGLWQFTRSTGRRYLRIDHVVDERMDPWRATHAAARLLRHNYDLTGSWPLAITAYNHGVSGMRRAAEKLGTRDIGVIVEKYRGRTFGFASRNFYAAFLAALDVSRDAERWFGPVRGHEAEPVEELEVPGFVEMDALIAALGLDRDTLRRLNPALREPVWNGTKYVPRGYRLRVPAEEGEVSRATLATLGPQLLHARQIPDRFYTVRRGDTLSGIAARYDVRPNTLAELNGLRSRHFIRVGQVLRLPFSESGSPTHPPGAGTTVERPADGIYRVRRGDTLSRIARRFDTTEKALMA
ncbi:MAG TPA: LysM peptidoglycan-binding domain-containing protein, partial [Thiotrichales bacterium]|nr:LysM peptidoglycan-binding domain-containing protein [Thiotrichales bacterium]